MSDLKPIVGAPLDTVSQKLVQAIESLPPDKVVQLHPSIGREVIPFLPPTLQKTDALFGLKLTLKKAPSMVHSGWLYSRYHNACLESGGDPSILVAHYSDGQFRQFGQFSIKEPTALFLGFDRVGANMLKVILQAESQFEPNDFDLDGYVK